MLFKFFSDALGARKPKRKTEQDVLDLIQSGDLAGARQAIEDAAFADPLAARCLAAEVNFRAGMDAEAAAGFREVLAQSPGHADAHYGLSLLSYETGDFDAAVRHAQFAANTKPMEGRFLAQLGLCHVRFGNYATAEGLLKEAVRLLPADKTCWNNMGIVQAAKGDTASASRCFSKALKLDPEFQNAKINLELLEAEIPEYPKATGLPGASAISISIDDGDVILGEPQPWDAAWNSVLAAYRQGGFNEAAVQVEEMVETWPDEPDVACKAARLYASQGDSLAGIDVLSAFLHRFPEHPRVMLALGKALAAQRQFKAGEVLVRQAIALGESSPNALSALGEILHIQEKYQEGTNIVQQAMDASADRPVALLAQLGAAQVMACRYPEAVATYDELFERTFRKRHPSLGGYSLCLTYLGRFDEALQILDELLEHTPNDAGLRLQRGQIRLLLGNFGEGWDDYLYRGLSYSKFFRALPFTRWQGEPLEGKRIIVLAEQGLGDQVMLASCLSDLLSINPAKVFVEVIDRVAPTLSRSFPQCEVIASRQNRNVDWVKQCGEVDYYVPLGDLPARFRRTEADFPRAAYLRADPVRVQFWRDTLRRMGPGPYIGVSWRGGTQLTRGILRSLPVSDLKALTDAVPGHWVCLQYGDVQAELAEASSAGLELSYWKPAVDDLDEFSALISALDGVVTVCNTTVHYAGALGLPVWILAPQIPEWRYGMQWTTLPWYPRAHVFRQSDPGNWTSPIQQVTQAMQTIFERKGTLSDKKVD